MLKQQLTPKEVQGNIIQINFSAIWTDAIDDAWFQKAKHFTEKWLQSHKPAGSLMAQLIFDMQLCAPDVSRLFQAFPGFIKSCLGLCYFGLLWIFKHSYKIEWLPLLLLPEFSITDRNLDPLKGPTYSCIAAANRCRNYHWEPRQVSQEIRQFNSGRKKYTSDQLINSEDQSVAASARHSRRNVRNALLLQ